MAPLSNEGTLTEDEREALQSIADRFNTALDVVGSRGAGKGRNVGTDLPFGKGEGTRNDIDVRVDGQREIETRGALSDALYNLLPGVSVSSRLLGGSYRPFFTIVPRQRR